MFETGSVKYDPILPLSEMSVEQLEAQLQAESAVLEFEIAALKARIRKRSQLPKAVGALALNVGMEAGQKTLAHARRDPLPFAAAVGGISWLVANVLARRKQPDVATQLHEISREKSTGLPSGYVPALGLILAAGTIAGARLAGRK